MVVFISILKSGATSGTVFFSGLKLQPFATMTWNVVNKNLKIKPQIKKWC
jgi:hypothetical protein